MVIFLIKIFLVLVNFIEICESITIHDEMLLTDEQKVEFEKFKKEALPIIKAKYMKQDIILIKYLRYSDFSAVKAMQKLTDNLIWREEWELDTLKFSDDRFDKLNEEYPFAPFKDKEGRYSLTVVGRHWDIAKAVVSQESKKLFIQWYFVHTERIYAASVNNITGKTSAGIIYFADTYDVDYIKYMCGPCLEVLKALLVDAESHWPGGLQMGFVINASPYVEQFVNINKQLLPYKIRDMFLVFGEDDTIWMPVVTKHINRTALPKQIYIRSKAQKGEGPAAASNAIPFEGLGILNLNQ